MSGGFKNKGPGGTELTAQELLWVQTANAGVLLLEEQSSPPGATSGFGKVYVKESDHLLYYLDEAGNEFLLSGASGGGGTILSPTGTIDGSNVDFVFSEKPDWIVTDGATFRENFGWTWNGGTNTATMSNPPTFDLWGVT